MEIYVEPNCVYKTELDILIINFTAFVNNLFIQNGLTTVKKIIITSMKTDEYSLSIITHSNNLRKHIHPPNDTSYGMVIDGRDENGKLSQIIFLRETIILACYMEYSKDNISNEILYHEIGHAIDNQNLFDSYNYISPDKAYDIFNDRLNYIKRESLLLWSEYFAQRVYLNYFNEPSRIDNPANIIECINNQLGNSIYEHSYRIAYSFVINIAYFHNNHMINSFFDEDNEKLSCYFILLKKLAFLLDALYKRLGRWSFDEDMSNLASVYENLIIIDIQQQSLI